MRPETVDTPVPAGVSLGYFHGEYVGFPEHVRPKNDPLLIRREANVRLQPVLMLGHVDELLGTQYTRLHEGWILQSVVSSVFQTEEIDPLAVFGSRDLARIAAVATDQRPVPGHIEMNRPLVA